MKKINIKKITMLSASALMLFGVGAGLVNTSSKNVQARDVESQYYAGEHLTSLDEAQSVLLNAGWSTKIPYNLHGKNSIKFHWYKKAQVKNLWNNVNVMPSIDWDMSTDDRGQGSAAVLGYVTLNGHRYYITQNDLRDIELQLPENFEDPTIMKAPRKIQTYVYGENGSDDNAYDITKGAKAQCFTIAPNAKSATLRMKNGKMKEFMPVTIADKVNNAGTCGGMITKEDYDTLTKTSQRVKYGTAYIQQTGSRVTTTYTKIARKNANWSDKHFLKNSRSKKRTQNHIKENFKYIAKEVAKGYSLDGLF